MEALELCLKCNDSIFNQQHFFQTDGTAQGPQMSCSYSDIAVEQFDKKALEYNPPALVGKGFKMTFVLV